MANSHYADYEQELITLLDSISTKLASSSHVLSGQLEECDELIFQMETEILGFSAHDKTQYNARVKGYKAKVTQYRQQIKNMNERSELMERSGNSEQRERLLDGTSRLYEGSRRLQDSHAIALETGANILGNLRSQREQIQHTHAALNEADSHVERAQLTLRGMARRAVTNRLIAAALILVLVALILLVAYAKFIR